MTSKKIAILALCLALVGGCASVKKMFCALDFDTLEVKLTTEVAYVDSVYWHYVELLKKGDEAPRPIVVAMDLFLATAKPILIGLQKGICYPDEQVQESLAFAGEVRSEIYAATNK
jgi:hypothetical protein